MRCPSRGFKSWGLGFLMIWARMICFNCRFIVCFDENVYTVGVGIAGHSSFS